MNRKIRYGISLLVFVLLFSLFYSRNESKPSEVVYMPEDASQEEILDELYSRGFIQNKFSYYILKMQIALGGEIEPGGYELKHSMGALALYARLVNPEYKYIRVEEGLRQEEIAELIGEKLDWDESKIDRFASNLPYCTLSKGEGRLFPGTYAIHRDEAISVIKEEMERNLISNIEEIYNEDDVSNIDLDKVLTIASMIQREAAGKQDMRLIAGIIWNRIFKGMPLQIDATLQYVKGDDELWWPQVHPKDKYLDSPYNTYQNKGLPPGPIASPGPAAIAAVLDPTATDCLFYLHDKRRNIHCATTYEGHKQNINYYLR